MMTKQLITSAFLTVGLISSATAATVVHFVDGSLSGAAALNTNMVTPSTGLVVSDLDAVGFGSTIARNEYGPGFVSTTGYWLFSHSSVVNGSGLVLANPVSTTDYFGFSVTNTTSAAVQLAQFSYDVTVASDDVSEGITGAWQMFYSLNDGDFNTIGAQEALTMPSNLRASVQDSFLVDLSAIILNEGDKVTFHLALADNANADSRALFTQNLMLTIVPEPASAFLLSLAFAGSFLRRRR